MKGCPKVLLRDVPVSISSVDVEVEWVEVTTLSPERTTRRLSRLGLNWEYFEHQMTRLQLRLRCSSRRALAWVGLIASAIPKIALLVIRSPRTIVENQQRVINAPFPNLGIPS